VIVVKSWLFGNHADSFCLASNEAVSQNRCAGEPIILFLLYMALNDREHVLRVNRSESHVLMHIVTVID